MNKKHKNEIVVTHQGEVDLHEESLISEKVKAPAVTPAAPEVKGTSKGVLKGTAAADVKKEQEKK